MKSISSAQEHEASWHQGRAAFADGVQRKKGVRRAGVLSSAKLRGRPVAAAACAEHANGSRTAQGRGHEPARPRGPLRAHRSCSPTIW